MTKRKLGRDPLDWIGKQSAEELDPQQEQQQEQQLQVKKRPIGRPQKIKREYEKSSQEGLPLNWTRYTIILREDLLELLKDYAWTDRRTMKEIVNEAIEQYLADKEIIERGKGND